MEHLLKIKDGQKKIKQKGVWRNICKNKLDKACFQYDFAYGVFKNLLRGAAVDKVLHDKALTITKNPNYDGY